MIKKIPVFFNDTFCDFGIDGKRINGTEIKHFVISTSKEALASHVNRIDNLKDSFMIATSLLEKGYGEVFIHAFVDVIDQSNYTMSEKSFLIFEFENSKSMLKLKNHQGKLLYAVGMPSGNSVMFSYMNSKDVFNVEKWICPSKMTQVDKIYYETIKLSVQFPIEIKFVGKYEFEDKVNMLDFLRKSLYLLDEAVNLNKTQKISPAKVFKIVFKKIMYTGTYGASVITLGHTPFTTSGTLFHEYGHLIYEKIIERVPTIQESEKATQIINQIIDRVLSGETVAKQLAEIKMFGNAGKIKDITNRNEVFARAIKCFTLLKTCSRAEHTLSGYYVFTSKTNQDIVFVDNLEYSICECEEIMPLFEELVSLMHQYKEYF